MRSAMPSADPVSTASEGRLLLTVVAVLAIPVVLLLLCSTRRPRCATLPPVDTVEEFGPSAALGPFQRPGDYWRRFKCWLKVVMEYPRLVAVFKRHRDDGWFQYGSPPKSFETLAQHPATQSLLNLRHGVCPTERKRRGGFKSTLQFEADFPVLPTYLPIEEGAAAALGAVSLAAAELYELRTGRAQRVVVSQSGAGLTTAQYLYIYVQPSGKWKGLHGFNGTMAAEGTVKPQRKA